MNYEYKCPICKITKANLEELNIHLDRDHFEGGQDSNFENPAESILNWIKTNPKKLYSNINKSDIQSYINNKLLNNDIDDNLHANITKSHWKNLEKTTNCTKCNKSFSLISKKLN